jgi:hypothetical protein
MRAEQFAERKCCVSQWCLPRNLSTSVSLTSLMQPRRTAEPAASLMKEDLDRRRGRVRYPWRTMQRCAVYCNGSSALPAPERANTANRMRAIFRDARTPNSAHVVAEAPRGWRKSPLPSLPASETDSCAAAWCCLRRPIYAHSRSSPGAVVRRARSSSERAGDTSRRMLMLRTNSALTVVMMGLAVAGSAQHALHTHWERSAARLVL